MTPEMYVSPKETTDAVQKRKAEEVPVESKTGSGKKVRKTRKKAASE
jgi:hypothetical protein